MQKKQSKSSYDTHIYITDGAINVSGKPSKTQFSESNTSEKLASCINAASLKFVDSIRVGSFNDGSGCGPMNPGADCGLGAGARG